MKTTILTLTLLILAGISCKKVKELTQFTMDYNQQVTIPSSSVIDLPFNIHTPDITTNSQSTFASNNTGKDLIEEIKLSRMDLTIQSLPTVTLILLNLSVFMFHHRDWPKPK